MNITIDLVLPPIIIAMLIGMIFSSNVLIMESTIDNRVQNTLQFTANNILDVIQEETRGIQEFLELEDDHIKFINFQYDTVSIKKSGKELALYKTSASGVAHSPEKYNARLSSLNFDAPTAGMGAPTLLRISLVTESIPDEEAGNKHMRLKAVAQRDIYLNNLHLDNNQNLPK